MSYEIPVSLCESSLRNQTSICQTLFSCNSTLSDVALQSFIVTGSDAALASIATSPLCESTTHNFTVAELKS